MGRKTTKDPQEWLTYQSRLLSLTLPPTYLEKVKERLPEKNVHRIKNARTGIVMDMEVLQVLESLSNEEKGRRVGAAYMQPATV